MAEKKAEESSDSEDYLSADEGLGNSRGSENRPKLDSELEKTNESRDSGDSRGHQGNGEVENRGERGEEEETRDCDRGQTVEEQTSAEVDVETKTGGQSSDSVTHEATVESRDCEKSGTTGGENAELKEGVERREGEGEGGEGERKEGEEEEETRREEKVIVEGETTEDVKEKEVVAKEEEEKPPIPPPRRKRKKKLQKNPSLEDFEKSLVDLRTRSMTVGTCDMTRERLATLPHVTSLSSSPSHPSSSSPPSSSSTATSTTTTAAETPDVKSPDRPDSGGVRGAEISPPSPRAAKSRPPSHETYPRRHPGVKNAPSISIEPDTNLELTEEMVHGQNKVMTRDTPLAKAYGSDRHEAEIIFDSDDESEGEGVYGSQELPVPTDHSDYGPDTETATEPGEGSEVVRGGGKGVREGGCEGEKQRKEKTPVGEEEEEEEEEGERARSPSDNQILQMTIVKNLDTGDSFPLSVVDEKIPLRNPLNQHLYRRTAAAMESHGDEGSEEEGHHRRRPQIRKKLRHFWGKKRTKGHGEGGMGGRGREGGEAMSRSNVTAAQEHDTTIKYKPSSHHKGPYEFDRVRLRQDLTGPHLGAVWVMEFSICGRLLAVAGQDSIVRVWVLRTAAQFFHELQAKYQRFGVHSSGESLAEKASMASTTSSEEDDANSTKGPFLEQPICMYHGHSADVLDLSWSKNFFLLSSSMDKTVRLWHISRKECLCCFQHVDFVTAIAFHPRDDRYFLSGSLDGKLRLWNIPDKRVALWNEIEGVGSHLITAANFCMNGKLAVAGTYDGRCIFYETEHLKYHTQIHVKSRHGKNRGRKVSGIEPLPGEEKILVTTNDSRLRLYNLKDHSLSCKYKGGLNTSSQIRATFSRDGLSIVCGSEDHFIYVWKTHHDVNKLSSVRRDRNEFYESFTTHHAPVTAAVFAPVPGITVDQGLKEVGQMIIAADYQGGIKVYVNSENL